MSARIPPGFAEAWWKFEISTDPEPMFTAVGIDLAVGVGATQVGTDNILAAGLDELRVFASSDYTVTGSHVIWGQDGADLRFDGSLPGQPGTGTSNPLPNNCASLVRKGTALGGRRGRGRMYIPGIAEANVSNNGTISTTPLATLQTAMNNFQLDIVNTAEVEALALLHSSAPFTPTAITDLKVQPRIATQRRRMRP
jgi:hypothetical protein